MTIPDEMVEAARMDGCSPMRFFFDILVAKLILTLVGNIYGHY